MEISIKKIPHSKQRYPTCGDYYYDKGKLKVRISQTGNADYEFLVMIHELVEYHLCQKKEIPIESIDAFDKKFEAERKDGDLFEPGNHPKAPYWKEHQIASGIERMLAAYLGVNWETYSNFIDSL